MLLGLDYHGNRVPARILEQGARMSCVDINLGILPTEWVTRHRNNNLVNQYIQTKQSVFDRYRDAITRTSGSIDVASAMPCSCSASHSRFQL